MPRTASAFTRSPPLVQTSPGRRRRASSRSPVCRATPAFFYRNGAGELDCGPAGAALTIAAPLALTWALWNPFVDLFCWAVSL